MPVFDFNTYQDVGITELYMPYIRADDQYQTVVNLNWMKGEHNLRFGTDIYFQGLNHTQPEFTGDNYGARGGFPFPVPARRSCLAGRPGTASTRGGRFCSACPINSGD